MIQLTPNELEQQFNQAMQLHKRGLLPQAESLYRSVLSQTPEYVPALKNYAVLNMQIKNFLIAEQLLGKVVQTPHNDEQVSINYAVCKLRLNKKEEAVAVLKQVLQHNPNSLAGNRLLSQIELPGKHYFKYLKDFHEWLNPETYIETGVFAGDSLVIANENTQSIGIDPEPIVSQQLNSNTQIYELTSDDFFAQNDLTELFNNRPVDFAFIDGLHIFEAALKDFINIEKYSKKETVILFHDCIPLNKITSERERVTSFWSGDIWKVVPCLKKYRPDLTIFTIPSPPTGLCVVTNLDSNSTLLSENYDEILEEYIPLDYNYIDKNKAEMLNIADNNWEKIQKRIRNLSL